MPTTINGLPVPEDNDPLGNGAQAIRDLVATLGYTQSGNVTVTLPSSGNLGEVIYFEYEFPDIPNVVISVDIGSGAGTVTTRTRFVTADQFTATINSPVGDVPCTIYWIAHYADASILPAPNP